MQSRILSQIVDGARNVTSRFPITLIFLAGLTIQLLFLIITGTDPNAWTFFFSVGTLITLLLHLWTEEVPELKFTVDNIYSVPPKAFAVWLIPLALLGVDSVVLRGMQYLHLSTGVAQGVFILALVIGICFLPFWKEKDDRKSWNFVFRLALGGIIANMVASVMMGGVSTLYLGSSALFGFETHDKVNTSLAVICLLTLPSLLFLILIPAGEKKHNQTLPKNGFVLGTVRYLFLPLVLLYMVVLYAYGAKILFTLTLPKGWLSILVSVLMCGLILVNFLLYPYLFDQKSKGYERTMMRWLPLATIPLIILMSIGLGRRFIDYGITANRLYILTLNVWFYAVALGIFFGRARRIHWISISATVILILTSCLPWNYEDGCYHYMLNRYETFAKQYPFHTKTIDKEALKAHLKQMPEKDAKLLYSTMDALDDYLDSDEFKKVTGYSDYLGYSYEDFMGIGKKNQHGKSYALEFEVPGYNRDQLTCDIPQGYKHMQVIQDAYENIWQTTIPQAANSYCIGYGLTNTQFTIKIEGLGTVNIPYRNLKQNNVLRLNDTDGIFVVLNLEIKDESVLNDNETPNFSIHGIAFYN